MKNELIKEEKCKACGNVFYKKKTPGSTRKRILRNDKINMSRSINAVTCSPKCSRTWQNTRPRRRKIYKE